MIKNLIERINTRSVVILSLVFSASVIAIKDPPFRSVYANLCSTAIGGYLGLTYPKKEKDSSNENIDNR
jgi:hypothetical protein